jgi:hypothetical protein
VGAAELKFILHLISPSTMRQIPQVAFTFFAGHSGQILVPARAFGRSGSLPTRDGTMPKRRAGVAVSTRHHR